MALLHELPTELIIKILDEVDLRTILRCRTLCRFFNDIITEAATLQYKVELVLSGMEDGPRGGMVAAERLQCLREHQSAWGELRFSQSHMIEKENGSTWELYGNVLAQGKNHRSIAFYQLPSAIRGIEAKSWEVQNLDTDVRDFGMDPAEDLLVFVEKMDASQNECRVHLRTLSEGKTHPTAPKPGILIYTPPTRPYSFQIQTSGELLGIIFLSGDMVHHLVIWNWKTGSRLLAIYEEAINAFMFLTQQHIAIAKIENGDVSLVVVNIQTSPHDVTSLNDVEPECEFLFPDLSPGYRVADVMFRSDPGPEWTPNPKLQVPFHISRKERLFIITVSVQSLGLGHVQTYAVFVPTSTLLRAMDSFAGAIEWSQWGPAGTRLRAPAPSFSDVWVCYVHGMSFASFLRGNRVNHRLFVLDFNQLAIRKAELEGRSKDTWQLLTNPTIIAHNAYSIFAETVETALPLRFRAHEVKWDPDFDPLTVMISEDAIILVERTTPSSLRRYRILTF